MGLPALLRPPPPPVSTEAPPAADRVPAAQLVAYVLAAALLHAALAYLEHRHFLPRPSTVLGGWWWVHACMVGAVLLGLWRRQHGQQALIIAILCATLVSLGILQPLCSAGLLLFAALSWLIARLALPAAARSLLVLGLYSLPITLRAGYAGQGAAAVLAGTTSMDAILWSSLAVRCVLYQLERSTLPVRAQGLGAYYGSFTLPLLCGMVFAPPIPYGQFLGRYGSAEVHDNMRRGLGLIAFGVLLLVAFVLLRDRLLTPGLSVLGIPGVSEAGALHGSRALTGLALFLDMPAKYLQVAGGLFVGIGNLRLLGFRLGSGFDKPFLSESFIDFWRRWFYYQRESARVLFYYPVLARARRFARPAAAQAWAVWAAMAGLLVLDDLIAMAPQVADPVGMWRSPRVWVPMVRTLCLAILTALSAFRLGAISRRSRTSRAARAWGIAITMALLMGSSPVFHLARMGYTRQDFVRLAQFLLGMS